MLHIATPHYKTPRWIEIQTRHLRKHISEPYQTWASLQLIDPSYSSHFDRIVEQMGRYPGKLNHLALEIAQEASEDDLLMFLAADAFPIADPMPLIREGLARAPLLAVRRAENADDPQPFAGFCATTVGAWRRLAGDWSDGFTWSGPKGRRVTDAGANLLRILELTGTPWVQVLRTSPKRLDPVFFAVYGEVIYSHGAGQGELSRGHLALAPDPLPRSRIGALQPAVDLLNRQRARLWESRVKRRFVRRSEALYEKMQRGAADWLADLG